MSDEAEFLSLLPVGLVVFVDGLALEHGAPTWAGDDVKLSREEIKRAFRARVLANQRQVAGEQVRPVITP